MHPHVGRAICADVLLINHNLQLRGGGGGGGSKVKSWNHDFEITGDPKGPPRGSTFW